MHQRGKYSYKPLANECVQSMPSSFSPASDMRQAGLQDGPVTDSRGWYTSQHPCVAAHQETPKAHKKKHLRVTLSVGTDSDSDPQQIYPELLVPWHTKCPSQLHDVKCQPVAVFMSSISQRRPPPMVSGPFLLHSITPLCQPLSESKALHTQDPVKATPKAKSRNMHRQ